MVRSHRLLFQLFGTFTIDFHLCSSHYASCLDYLGNLKANLLLDIHLHDHVETLYDQIRNKALIQYTHPFVSVDLRMMANAFKTSVSGLEKELEALITDNQIQVCAYSFILQEFSTIKLFSFCHVSFSNYYESTI